MSCNEGRNEKDPKISRWPATMHQYLLIYLIIQYICVNLDSVAVYNLMV